MFSLTWLVLPLKFNLLPCGFLFGRVIYFLAFACGSCFCLPHTPTTPTYKPFSPPTAHTRARCLLLLFSPGLLCFGRHACPRPCIRSVPYTFQLCWYAGIGFVAGGTCHHQAFTGISPYLHACHYLQYVALAFLLNWFLPAGACAWYFVNIVPNSVPTTFTLPLPSSFTCVLLYYILPCYLLPATAL